MPQPALPLEPVFRPMRARRRAGRPWGTRFELAVFLSDTQRANTPDILAQLPPKSWVIFRHYSLDGAAREEAARQWQQAARACGHAFLVSGDARLARRIGAGLHLRAADTRHIAAFGALRRGWLRGPLASSASTASLASSAPLSFAAHTVPEVRRAEGLVKRAAQSLKGPTKAHSAGRMKARPALLMSPVFQTRSHMGAAGLGVHGLARLMRVARQCECVALGGVGARSARRLTPLKRLRGVAAIDGFASKLTD